MRAWRYFINRRRLKSATSAFAGKFSRPGATKQPKFLARLYSDNEKGNHGCFNISYNSVGWPRLDGGDLVGR
jgi:hypothetical protein